jgi:DSF synthase
MNVIFDPAIKTYWAAMRPSSRPVITRELLKDMRSVQDAIAEILRDNDQMVEYLVLRSEQAGVFNLGGDLHLFADRIRAKDRAGLQAYAYACIDVLYRNARAFDVPMVTIALVQGDALGGGFETALSFDVIVAERGAKMGLPEVLFNLFPGMGAYSFLSRKIGMAAAEKLIMSGKVYTAEELYDLGVVNILADDGDGVSAVTDYIASTRRKGNAHRAMSRVKRQVNPVTYDELRSIVDIWVDAALQLGEQDLKKMARLTSAQLRRFTDSQSETDTSVSAAA